MAKKLSDIAITHISLVKAGANGKSIIYKSKDGEPSYTKTIKIKKSDEEGVVYGIVYSPDQEDSQGDFATADEIKKAAYAFMKNRNTLNVDKDHSFDIEKAFVSESWVLKENDPVFPDEPAGSWAVAIQLEDEELKKSAKNGDIGGISMAGTALKEDVEKADAPSFSIDDFVGVFKKLFSSTSISLNGSVYNDKINKSDKQEEDLKKEDLESAITAAVEPLVKKVGDLEANVTALQKSASEHAEALKKSKQDNDPVSGEQNNRIGWIL